MSSTVGSVAASRAATSEANASPAAPAGTKTTPGFVHSWPPKLATEAVSPSAIASARASSAASVTTRGLTLPISANTGIGAGRAAARSYNARPPASEPVKPTAAIPGSSTRVSPTSAPADCTRAKAPSGRPAPVSAARTSRATTSLVPGWEGCPLTTTGQPAASADAVSPPATEKASGKFDAPKTATGPSGTRMRRTSGRGIGTASGSGRSMIAST